VTETELYIGKKLDRQMKRTLFK